MNGNSDPQQKARIALVSKHDCDVGQIMISYFANFHISKRQAV